MSWSASETSHRIWEAKYRNRDPLKLEMSIADTWQRVAQALAAVEPQDADAWTQRFYEAVEDFRFLPAGRIQAGAGTGRKVSLFSCFVMGAIEDSIPGIFHALSEGAITMQQGGGVGYDFSTLRPKGSPARSAGSIASGPVSFMHVWDAMCATILSTGARRGAMMATLRCDHPDIEAFIDAKREPGILRHFNLSVQVTDAFMDAVRSNAEWPLVFPAEAYDDGGEIIERTWTGKLAAVPCRVLRRVRARELWDRILHAAYDCAEPGVLFVDRINQFNNLGYREQITATNPCGEVPLPPYGACALGSINLTRFVREPFSRNAKVDGEALARTAAVAVRMLDNVIDASPYPLPAQAESAHATRRIGLGLTGLGDALVMLGLGYNTPEGRDMAAEVMRAIRDAAYRASIALAREKGPFPAFERDAFLEAPFIRSLPDDLREAIALSGVRNSHLLAIAPTATISLLAGNVSSGLEPIFAANYGRKMLDHSGSVLTVSLSNYALELWRELGGAVSIPPGFITAGDLPAIAHLRMQAALQPFVDNAISKTVNTPETCPFDSFRLLYDEAYDLGLKGITAFRPNPVTSPVLVPEPQIESLSCWEVEREVDYTRGRRWTPPRPHS